METRRKKVGIVYNHVGEDIYEKIRHVDPSSLPFTPEYKIDVATVQEEYQALATALGSEGFEARLINLGDSLEVLFDKLRKDPPDVVFNLVEHLRENSHLESAVAGVFEILSIPYTGAPPFALQLCQRKGMTKQLLREHGIRTPRFRLLHEEKALRRHGLRYPLIVKPAREDASSGVDARSVVGDLDSLLAQLHRVFEEFAPPILIEEFIDGRELHVGVLGNSPAEVLPILEYDFGELPPDHPRLLSYDVKWDPLKEAYHRVHTVCPADLPKTVERRVKQAALHAYELTNCRDYARVDIRLSTDNKPYVLEVNPNPDLTEGVSFMESAENRGLTFSQTLRMIVEFALRRGAVREKPVSYF